MATASSVSEVVFEWEGRDRNGKVVRGETRAVGENQVTASLRRQGVTPIKIKKRRMRSGQKIKPKDLAIFTRQLATMMKAGVPLLQAFDIVGRGNANASVTKLLNDIRTDVETGTSLSAAFRKYPIYFDNLYCNLVEAGEAAGILEALLDRLAVYMEKTEAIKSKIKSALMYPISVVVVAFVVVAVIMIFVIPAFKDVFSSFGAEMPAPTLLVMAMSDAFVTYWWLIFGVIFGGGYTFMQSEGSAGGDVSLNVATVRVGHEILPFIAIEGEASTGISDGHYQVSGSAYADVTLKSQVGIFAVGRLPVPARQDSAGRIRSASRSRMSTRTARSPASR